MSTAFDPFAVDAPLYALCAPLLSIQQACYNHAVSASSGFYTAKTSAGVIESTALMAFLSSPPDVLRFVDDCKGFACGTGCGASKSKTQSPMRTERRDL